MKDVMRQSIEGIAKQFNYEAEIGDVVGHLAKFEKFAFFGMGGSGLLADALLFVKPELDILIHKDYGLPKGKDLSERLLVFVSYSGNTEEVIDSFETGLKEGHHLAVISTGGKLLKRAKELGVLYVEIPDMKIQPRTALPLMMLAAAKLMQDEDLTNSLKRLGKKLKIKQIEIEGEKLSERLQDKLPVIYSSASHKALAYNWKINFNETGKIPAFHSPIPESNHNEINGFEVNDKNSKLSAHIVAVFLKDKDDHPRIAVRMNVLRQVYRSKGVPVEVVDVEGKDRMEKFFQSTLLASWTAYYTALFYGSWPNDVPMVEDFKAKIKK